MDKRYLYKHAICSGYADPPPLPQFCSRSDERCALCWIEWKINFPNFLFSCYRENSSKIGQFSVQKWEYVFIEYIIYIHSYIMNGYILLHCIIYYECIYIYTFSRLLLYNLRLLSTFQDIFNTCTKCFNNNLKLFNNILILFNILKLSTIVFLYSTLDQNCSTL